jgi:membrane dipeptidase
VGVVSRVVDRLLHTAPAVDGNVGAEALELHLHRPVVDLVVGTALFRNSFLARRERGHVDLPRLRDAGVNLVGLTIATRHPDLRGTLSGVHFRSLGMPAGVRRSGSNMAIAEWLIERVERWSAASGGSLRVVTTADDVAACLRPGGPTGAFLGVQGGHVLDGDLRNIERLSARGVRMLGPAHVMDNELVGSGTGRRRGRLTPFGREAISALEEAGILVDLAHMSLTGIADSLRVVRRPFVLSHTGFVERSGRSSRWRRYSPAARNIPISMAGEVAAAGGIVGVILASDLLGGDDPGAAAESIRLALEVVGAGGVAIGSDMDGGLRTVVDAASLPLVTQRLLDSGVKADAVSAVLGGNALRTLGHVLT